MDFTAEIKADSKTVATIQTTPAIPQEGFPNELLLWGGPAEFEVNGKRYALTLSIMEEPDDSKLDNLWNALAQHKHVPKRRND